MTANFCNMSEQLVSAEAEAQSISSLPPLLSVSHWLRETNDTIMVSEDTKVLRQHKECFQACHKGMVGLEVFFSSQQRIYRSTLYRIHNQFVEPTPQVLDFDHDLLASAKSVVSIKTSEFRAIESLVRVSLRVLSNTLSILMWSLLSLGHHVFRCYSTSSCLRLRLFCTCQHRS